MMLVLVLILATVLCFLMNFGGYRWIELILRVFSVQYVVSTLVPINYASKFCFYLLFYCSGKQAISDLVGVGTFRFYNNLRGC